MRGTAPEVGPSSFFHATALAFVAYTGYGRIATLGEEVVRPAVTIPRAVVVTLLVSMVVYVGVTASAVAAVGAPAFAASASGDAAPLQAVASTFEAGWVAPVVALAAITAMVGVLLNLILGLSRVVLAMARRGDLPTPLGQIAPGQRSPVRAVWAVAVVVAVLVALGEVRTTWTLSAVTVLVYYGITNLAALHLPDEARRFPRGVAVLGLASCFALAIAVPWGLWAG